MSLLNSQNSEPHILQLNQIANVPSNSRDAKILIARHFITSKGTIFLDTRVQGFKYQLMPIYIAQIVSEFEVPDTRYII